MKVFEVCFTILSEVMTKEDVFVRISTELWADTNNSAAIRRIGNEVYDIIKNRKFFVIDFKVVNSDHEEIVNIRYEYDRATDLRLQRILSVFCARPIFIPVLEE